PIDRVNPNRVFPGKPDGSFTEQLAHFIFTTCIAPSQAFMDLHGGDMVEELAPFGAYSADADPAVTSRSRAMAEAYGLQFTTASRDRPEARSGLTHVVAA